MSPRQDVWSIAHHLGPEAPEATQLAWLEEIVIDAIRGAQGCLEPRTLFDGLNAESVRLMARVVTNLTDRNVIATRYEIEDGKATALIGFDVSDKAPSR